MKKIAASFLFISTFVIATFLLFQDAESAIQQNLTQTSTRWLYSLLSGVFLLSDIVIPVPSSLIMILNGKVLGFVLGTVLSFVSGVLSSCIGFFIGRKSSRFINKFLTPKDIENANHLYNKYGKLTVALTRAIPILSETIAVISGTTTLKFRTFVAYASIGHLVVSAAYAWVGAFANSLDGNFVTIGVVGVTLLLSWVLHLIVDQKNKGALD